jgi:hypothetical protein
MTDPKAWVQRERKRLVHEVRSKAHRRLHTVIWVSALIMFIYIRVGEAARSIELATDVPLVWKCLMFLTLLGMIWYLKWRMWRRTFEPSCPRFDRSWFFWLAAVAFSFAVISADVPALFYGGTLSCLVFLRVMDWYYGRKLERLKRHEAHTA